MTGHLLNRLEVDVKVVDLPRLGEREQEGFLKYRIAGLYPGQPEQTAFDYRILERGGRRQAVLFITRRALLESSRQEAGGKPLLLPYLLLQPYLGRAKERDAGFLVILPECIDIFLLPADAAPEAAVVKRTFRLAADLEALRRLVTRDGFRPEWTVLHGTGEEALLAELPQALGGHAQRLVGLDEARPLARERGLFAPPQRAPRLAPKWRRQLLAIAVLLLAWLVGNKLTDRQEGTLRSLLREAAVLERRSAAAAALQAEVDTLLDQVETLRAKRPVDPYRLLTELQAVLGPEARLQSFLLERRFFQIEAVGANPLRLMDAFGGSVYFGETRLLQTVPLSGSEREAFKITGSVRGE